MEIYLTAFNLLGIVFSFIPLKCSIKMLLYKEEYYATIALCQLFFLLELFNSLLSKSKSKFLPTLLQLTSRVFISSYIIYYTRSIGTVLSAIMFIAWYISDLIRYVYYTTRLKAFMKLRYSLFIILYPLGTVIEVISIIKSANMTTSFKYPLYFITIMYVPGFYVLFSHMIKQRKSKID